MNLIQIFNLVSEAGQLFQELQADGSITTIMNAVKAVETELANPKAKDLIAQIEAFFSKGK